MKKMVFSLIGAFALMAVVLIGFMIYVISRDGSEESISQSKLHLVNTQNVKLDGIDAIDIKFYSDDIEFLVSDSNELILKEYKTYTPDPDELATVSTNGNAVSIRGKMLNIKRSIFSFKNYYSKAEIYLPADYMNSLSVSTSSGDVFSDLVMQFKQFEVSCTSGDVKLNQVLADTILATTSSGNVTIQKAEGNRKFSATSGEIKIFGGKGDSEIDTSSGDIYIENSIGTLRAGCTSGDITIRGTEGEKKIDTSSGDIRIEDSKGVITASSTSGEINVSALDGGGEFEASSGDITLDVLQVASPISMDASSGDVRLSIPAITCFDFTADTSSGDIRTDFDDLLTIDKNDKHAVGTIGDNPEYKIQLRTSSGDIKVQKN